MKGTKTKKVKLSINEISVLRAIYKRNRLYDCPGQLGLIIFRDTVNTPSQAEISIRRCVETGLRFLKFNFGSIDEDGNVVSIQYDAPDFQKNFLKEIKEKFLNFQELETIVQEFLSKKEGAT